MSIAVSILVITFSIMLITSGIMVTALSIRVPLWHTLPVASAFRTAVFAKTGTAQRIRAVTRTRCVQMMDTAATLPRDVITKVSSHGTLWDKAGHLLREVMHSRTDAVPWERAATGVVPDATSQTRDAVLNMGKAMPLIRTASAMRRLQGERNLRRRSSEGGNANGVLSCSPGLAHLRLPWVGPRDDDNPNGVAAIRLARGGRNPFRVDRFLRDVTQGGSGLATLGWGPERHWRSPLPRANAAHPALRAGLRRAVMDAHQCSRLGAAIQ